MVTATEAALWWIARLRAQHGPLMFHLACCDGSSPMCHVVGDFTPADRDVLIGQIGGCPFYVGGQPARVVVDVVAGHRAGCSLGARDNMRFVTRSVGVRDQNQAVTPSMNST